MTLANQLTLLRIILSPIFAFVLFKDGLGWKYFSIVIFVIASLTDLYDGILARKYGIVTKLGKFLDPLADKILVSTAFVCLSVFGYVEFWMVMVVISRDFIITTLRSYALYRNYPIQTMMLAKWKTAIQDFTVYFILAIMIMQEHLQALGKSFFVLDLIREYRIISWVMWLVIVLTVYTGIKYLVDNRNYIKNMLLEFYHVFAPSDL